MAWYLGYPLSQTLLTNLYIEGMLMPTPTNIQEADFIRNHKEGVPRDPMFTVLRAYCLGLLKSCWHVNERIKSEHFYEVSFIEVSESPAMLNQLSGLQEEDFVTNTYHRFLLQDIDRILIRDEIMAARRLLHTLRPTISDEMADALSFRLELRTAFLRAIELSELRSNPESLSLPWSQMKAVWEPIRKSRHLGTPVPEAFSTKIQRRLASTMPPRPIVQPSFEETSEHFMKLFSDGIEMLKVLKYSDSQSLLVRNIDTGCLVRGATRLTSLQHFVMLFQAQKPQPLVFIRTLLQSLLFGDMIILGRLSIRQVVDDDLAIVVLPCSQLLDPANDDVEAPHDARFAIAFQMENFRQRAAQSYLDIFRTFCQNRCRVRRTLCHQIQDWETVQFDAEEIDQLLQVQLDEKPLCENPALPGGAATEGSYSLPLSSWAYLYKIRLMEWIVQLGFELQTYQPDELAGMYWYLSFLAHQRGQIIERINKFTTHHRDELRRAHPYGLTTAMEAQFTRSINYLRHTHLDAAATWEFADALSCLYTALGRLKLVVPPPRPYSTDELRYEIRMKPFVTIGTPELPTFQDFTRAVTQPDYPTEYLLNSANAHISQARSHFDTLSKVNDKDSFTIGSHERWLKSTKDSLRSAISANIALSTLRKSLGKDILDMPLERATLDNRIQDRPGQDWGINVEVPKPEKTYHSWWIVPKISEK